MTQETKLKISGMSCQGCAGNVEKALRGVKGVSAASVDLGASQASVQYDPAKTNPKALADAVKKAGYGAS